MVFCEESDLWARYWENNVFCILGQHACTTTRTSYRQIRGATLDLGDKKKLKWENSVNVAGDSDALVACPLWPLRGRLACPSEGVRGLSRVRGRNKGKARGGTSDVAR